MRTKIALQAVVGCMVAGGMSGCGAKAGSGSPDVGAPTPATADAYDLPGLGSGGVAGGSGGSVSTGGVASTGGTTGAAGTMGTGGAHVTGGAIGAGGVTATGGRLGSGGLTAAGGSLGSGGVVATGGVRPGSGGATGTGGRSGSGGVTGTGGAVDGGTATDAVNRYAWTAAWGPCQPTEVPCQEALVVTSDGTVTYTLHGTMRSAALTSSDLTAFQQFLADANLVAALSSSAACPAPVGVDRSETVVLTYAGSGATLSKNVFGCAGGEYDVINSWTKKLRTYFP